MHDIEEIIILDPESPIFSVDKNNGLIEIDNGNELASYIYYCAKSLTAISSALDKARMSLVLLDVGFLERYESEEFPRSKYIELLIENSIIRAQSIYERVLIFVNRLFSLGISNDSISHNLIVCNENVKKFGLEISLKAINKVCTEYRYLRNTVIHHDRFSDDQLDKMNMVMDADRMSRKYKGEAIIDEGILRSLVEDYLGTKKNEFDAYLNKIESKLYAFYGEAIPIYQNNKEKFRKV